VVIEPNLIDDRIKLTEAIVATGWSRLSRADAEAHAEALAPALLKYGINTPRRAAACLAQFAHETGGWRWLRELGGAAYFRKYEGRQDLGNVSPGDGARYRGRGYIQITGKFNYALEAIASGLPLLKKPELLEEKPHAAMASCRFWWTHGLNGLADRNQFTTITRIINGGVNGLEDRKVKWKIAKTIMQNLHQTGE
jgi:putative chitinase